jgi:hypothetical protein
VDALGREAGDRPGPGLVRPHDARSQADGKVATEKVVAFDLGTCHGKRAYLKYEWYFPAYRKPPSRKHANNACL